MSSLPKYYEKYFDEKFSSVTKEFEDVKETLTGINEHLRQLNSKVAKNKQNIAYLGFAIMALTPVYISESRQAIVSVILGLVGLK